MSEPTPQKVKDTIKGMIGTLPPEIPRTLAVHNWIAKFASECYKAGMVQGSRDYEAIERLYPIIKRRIGLR